MYIKKILSDKCVSIRSKYHNQTNKNIFLLKIFSDTGAALLKERNYPQWLVSIEGLNNKHNLVREKS